MILKTFGEGSCLKCHKPVSYEQFKTYRVDTIYRGNETLYIHRKCWWKIVLEWQEERDLELKKNVRRKKL